MSDEETVARVKKLLGNYERLIGLIDVMDMEYYLVIKNNEVTGVMNRDLIELGKREAFCILAMSRYFTFNSMNNYEYLGRKISIDRGEITDVK